MKKMFAILLAMLLAMLLVIGCAGCSKTEDESVEKSLNAYLDYLSDGYNDYDAFVKGAEKYLDPNGQAIKDLENNKNFIVSSVATFTSYGINKQDAEKIVIHTLSEVAKSASYEIEKITVDGNEATVKVQRTIADNNKLGQIVSNLGSTTLNALLDEITDAARDTNNHISESTTITLTKIDGNWLISSVR